jgi:hypothetical protein
LDLTGLPVAQSAESQMAAAFSLFVTNGVMTMSILAACGFHDHA